MSFFISDEQSEYLKNLTALVEDTYYTNNNQKVVLIGHSLGCLFAHYFLQKQSSSWKAKFIDAYVSISGPYIGAVKSLKAIVSGEQFRVQVLYIMGFIKV